MLGRQVEAVLLLWLSCCVLAVWRYSMKSTIYSIFSTRSSIILEYEGDTFKSWDIPEGCKVQNKSSPKTLLYCKTPGNHKISPININDMQEDERLLTVDSSNICFLWYYTVVDVFFNLSQIITIWVYDPENASPEELQWTAKEPSVNSMVLTKQMNTLGQYPVIYTLEKGLKYDPGPLTPDGTWIIHLPMTSDDIIKQIRAMPDMILWDGHSTYYSHNNFTEVGIIETDSGNTNLSLIAEGSKVHNVVADTTGNILVKMENNDLFYIKDGIAEIVPLSRWVNTTAETALVLDKSFQVNILHYNQNLDEKYQLHLQSYPLVLELQSKNKGLEDMCPYLTFQHDVHSQFYHLDKGDSLTVWTQIVYPENRGLDILVDYYGSNILTWTQNTEYEIASGFCTKSMITRFFQTTNYESVKNYYDLEKKNTGLTLIKIRPSEYTRTCPTVIPVFEISVGCDPTKYIQVQGFNNTRCHRRDFSYVIDKELLRDSPHENLKVRYEVAKYGCPRTVDMEEMFHPVVELYDENGFIKIVDANFILWEVHGRNDYMYNSTMQQNGCINEAQTWDIMIEENPGVPMEDIWGPQNYRPCFSYAIGTPGDLSQPYEIINYSNKNALKWSSSYAAMYVYRLKVLDPNYSFCNLTTYFAIESLGQIPRSSIYLVAALVFVLMLTFISVLVLSYFWYSKIYRRFIIEPLHKPPGKQKKN
ncbi:cation channel sperm-associated auxiliary subunit epsilon isoform X13 [Rattus norvegicus]|uniref:cation channel sperm-associated auxiliary subunit epsilon isoform X13 n=1 Tax=Rattus norvegicus TaxID=10116 RepID=UPI0019175D21|nr:cation channel sperm-associated auxiliary subunit epsilon isoform X12 [Rattus norvegicus]